MSSHPLDDAKLKIETADRHILNVKAEREAFFGNPPPQYEIFRQLNADGTREALKIRVLREPPRNIAPLVSDCVTNLRSALDFLTCKLALQHDAAVDLSGVEWPFANSPKEFESQSTQKKIKKLSTDAADLIRSYHPYHGGNDLLWSMNELRRPNIHRHFVTSIVAVRGYQGRAAMNVGIGFHTIEQPRWSPLDQEVTLLTFTPGAELKHQTQAFLDIAFRDIEPIEGQPVIDVLHQFARLTEHILLTFERRFFP